MLPPCIEDDDCHAAATPRTTPQRRRRQRQHRRRADQPASRRCSGAFCCLLSPSFGSTPCALSFLAPLLLLLVAASGPADARPPALPTISPPFGARKTTNAARKVFLSLAEKGRRDWKKLSSRVVAGGGGDDTDMLEEEEDPSLRFLSFPAINLHRPGGVSSASLLKTCQDVGIKLRKRGAAVKINLAPLRAAASPLLKTGGGFYGVKTETVQRYYSAVDEDGNKKVKPKRMKESMSEALDELRLMRVEMEALRRELHDMKRRVTGEDEGDEKEQGEAGLTSQQRRQKQKRQREFDAIAREVERWAEGLEKDEDGWVHVKCSKMFDQTLNANGRTKAYLRWMKDSRGKHARDDDNKEYPCLRVCSTIDAPFDEVCIYLSEPSNIQEYNDLIVKHKDLEVISPHSKICWVQTPQLLFVKPRDMITFCSHRWLRDGTQVVVNQACDDYESDKEVKLKNPKAYALRGANFISPHPDDPSKTLIRIICHANPGEDVPTWAARTAINSLVPIEPFKLFHKINNAVSRHSEDLQKKSMQLRNLEEMEMASSSSSTSSEGPASDTDAAATTPDVVGRSNNKLSRKPAGIAQLGYACFWPEGGGIQEGGMIPWLSINKQQQQATAGKDGETEQEASTSGGGEAIQGGSSSSSSSSQQITGVAEQGSEAAVAVPAS